MLKRIHSQDSIVLWQSIHTAIQIVPKNSTVSKVRKIVSFLTIFSKVKIAHTAYDSRKRRDLSKKKKKGGKQKRKRVEKEEVLKLKRLFCTTRKKARTKSFLSPPIKEEALFSWAFYKHTKVTNQSFNSHPLNSSLTPFVPLEKTKKI